MKRNHYQINNIKTIIDENTNNKNELNTSGNNFTSLKFIRITNSISTIKIKFLHFKLYKKSK